MLAPNHIYATLPNYYPRLLADDGVHEPLILPYNVDVDIAFEFRTEAGLLVSAIEGVSAILYKQSGGTQVLPVSGLTLNFDRNLEDGLVYITVQTAGLTYACYPFRITRSRP